MLQVVAELGRGGVHKAVGEGAHKRVAGMLRADEPLAHGQRFHAGRRHHIARAGIDEHLSMQPTV